jgi:hypothetical protein
MTGVLASSGGNNTGHRRHQQQQQQHHHVQSQDSVENSQARLEQLFDEQDHKRCAEGNRKALLAENLDQLRGLVKILEADDWKYNSSSGANSNNNNNNGGMGFSWSSGSRFSSGDGSSNT